MIDPTTCRSDANTPVSRRDAPAEFDWACFESTLTGHPRERLKDARCCHLLWSEAAPELVKEAHISRLEPEAGVALAAPPHIKPELLLKLLLLVFLSDCGRQGRLIGLISTEPGPDCAAFLYHRCSHRSR